MKWFGADLPGSPLILPRAGGSSDILFSRAAVIAKASKAGRTSTASLKIPGVDTLPTGASWDGVTVNVTGNDVNLVDWKINRIAGSGLRCILSLSYPPKFGH